MAVGGFYSVASNPVMVSCLVAQNTSTYGAGGGGIWPLYYANFLKTHTKGGGLMVFTVE